MKKEKVEGLNEKNFVVSLIMSDKVCKVLIPYIQMNYFETDYARIVVQWTMDYWTKFKHSPKDDITSIYLTRCNEIRDEAVKDLVAVFIQNLSESNLNINNEDYLVDRSKDFIDSRSLKTYTEELNACLEVNNLEKARTVQQNYRKITETETNEVSLFSKESIKIYVK